MAWTAPHQEASIQDLYPETQSVRTLEEEITIRIRDYDWDRPNTRIPEYLNT